MGCRIDPVVGLSTLLRQLRLRAGYTQAQVAAAMGLQGRGNFNLVSRLERGKVRNPSLRTILDFLRACGATLDDLKPFLFAHLSEPLKVPERTNSRRRLPNPLGESAEDLKLRIQAAYWKLQQGVENLLHRELNRLGAPPFSSERQRLCLFGRKVFRILYATRNWSASNRQKRLLRCRQWAQARRLNPDAITTLEQAVTVLFEEMRESGELDRLPLLDEAKYLEQLGGRHRLLSDRALCRQDMFNQRRKEFEELMRRRGLVEQAALRLLEAVGITGNLIGNYRGAIIGLINACIATRANTPEREQSIRLQLSVADPRFTDRAIVQRLAAAIQRNWDEATADSS